MPGWIVLLTKEPAPGLVKTRLGKVIGMAEAASLATCLLEDSLEVALRAAEAIGATLAVAHTPDALSAAFGNWVAKRAPTALLIPQGEGDLGARLATALDRFQGPRIALGSDAPDLPPEAIANAFVALEEHDSVLGPTDDGGYYLIGFAAGASPDCLRTGVRWSTSDTLSDTEGVLRAGGLGTHRLLTHPDLDDMDALRALTTRTGGAPHTRAWLQAHPDTLRPSERSP